jgi:hypothetical protein
MIMQKGCGATLPKAFRRLSMPKSSPIEGATFALYWMVGEVETSRP